MHSWSLLSRYGDGRYAAVDHFALEAFEAMVATLASERRTTTFADLDPGAPADVDVLALPM